MIKVCFAPKSCYDSIWLYQRKRLSCCKNRIGKKKEIWQYCKAISRVPSYRKSIGLEVLVISKLDQAAGYIHQIGLPYLLE